MADSQVFDRTCELVAEFTSLNQLEAQGTVRHALEAANLSPERVGREEMIVAVQCNLVKELAARDVADASGYCGRIVAALRRFESSEASPYEVFAKLG